MYEDWIELTKEDGTPVNIRRSVIIKYYEDHKRVIIEDMNGVKLTLKEKMQEFKAVMGIK